jgi:plasmid stability protein
VRASGTGLHMIISTLIMCEGRWMPTLTIDEETLRRARIRALEQGTSVNAVVREFLQRYAEDESTIGRAAQGAVGRGADRHRLEGAGR